MPCIPSAKNANKEGMAKTTAEDSDTDESYDSLPELVACSDDEDSEEEEYRKKSASKTKTRGKDKSSAKAKNNAECADMWYKLSKDEKESHIRVMRIYLLSPFLFGQVYQDDKWINWAYDCKLLPSKSDFEIKELNEERFDLVDLVETAFNKLAENVLLKNKDGLVKTLDIIGNPRMTTSQHIDKAITCAESFLTFTNTRDRIKLKPGLNKKQADVALLLAHNQVADHIKQLAAGVDLAEQFNKRCKEEEEKTVDKKKEGNDAFTSGKYTRAISVYSMALHMSPYNHVLYCNRSQSFLKTKQLGSALADGRRAVVLKADWHKAQYRYAQAFFETGNITRAKEANRAACKICSDKKDLEAQYRMFERVAKDGKGKTTENKKPSKTAVAKQKDSRDSEPEDLPALVDPESSDTSRDHSDDEGVPDLVDLESSEDSDDSDDNDKTEDPHSETSDGYESNESATKKKSAVSTTSKKRDPSKKVKQLMREALQRQAKTEEKPKKEEKQKKPVEPTAKKEAKKPVKQNKKVKVDQSGNHPKLREFTSYLKQGSKALVEKKNEIAAFKYGEAIALLKEHQYQDFEMKEIDFVILLYSFGAALLEVGGQEELLAAKKHFDIIVVEHKNVVFPLAYLGTGRVFYKQNRFTDALGHLEDGLGLVNKLGDEKLASYRWPGSQVIIDDTKPGKLLSAIQTLIRICHHPPRPDAKCIYAGCPNKQIYLTDPDYKGYIRLICHGNCKVDFHPGCWKKKKGSEEGKSGDKDFLDDICMTPDCEGSVTNVQIYDSEGLKTEFKHDKPTTKQETKPKQSKQNKLKANVARAKQKKKKDKDDVKIEDFTTPESSPTDIGEEKVVYNPPPPPPLAGQKEEKQCKGDHNQLEKSVLDPADASVPTGDGVFILKKEEDEDPVKGVGVKGVSKVKTKKKKLKNTQTLDEFLKDHGGLQTLRPTYGEDSEDLGEIPHPKSKFDLATPPPGWTQQEMETPFAIPPHLQDSAAEFEASYRMEVSSDIVSTPLPPPPSISLRAVTEYVSSMLHEILRVQGGLELADPNIMQPLSMLPDDYQDIISKVGGLRAVLENSGKFLFDGNRVMLPEDKEFEDLVKTLKPASSNNPFLDWTNSGLKTNIKLANDTRDNDESNSVDDLLTSAGKPHDGGVDSSSSMSSSPVLNPNSTEFVSSSQTNLLSASSSKTSIGSDSTLKGDDDEQMIDGNDTTIEDMEQNISNGETLGDSISEGDLTVTKFTNETQRENYQDFASDTNSFKAEHLSLNDNNVANSSFDAGRVNHSVEKVEKERSSLVASEDNNSSQSNQKLHASVSTTEPAIVSKTKAVQTQPNVKSKGVGTDPIPEPFKAEYQRVAAEKDALQARLQENVDRHNALLNKNSAELEKVKKKLADALQEKEKYLKDVQEVKKENQEEIRKLRQQCEDKDDKIKALNHKLLQDAQEKTNMITSVKKELSAVKGQHTSEKESWNKERSEKDELLKTSKAQLLQQQARALDAEVKLLELRRDVGLRFLERAFQESHITINNLIQAVNARIAGPKVEELVTAWKNYTSECHQRIMQCKATFNEQIELLKNGRTLSSLPQLNIPGPPPYPGIPVLQSLVPGQQQNQTQAQPQVQPQAQPQPQPQPPLQPQLQPQPLVQHQPSPESNSSTPEPPVPTSTAIANAGVPLAAALPPAGAVAGAAAAVGGEQPLIAGNLAAGGAVAAAPDKARPSNSFEKIMLRLSTMYPNFTRLELTGFIKEVRHNKHGSLTGLSLEDIVANVSDLVEQKKKAGLLRTTPVPPAKQPQAQKTQQILISKLTSADAAKMTIGSGNYEEDPCVICHEDMNASIDIVTLECGHRYHSPCIRKWLLGEQSTCPTCRVHALLPDEFPRLR